MKQNEFIALIENLGRYKIKYALLRVDNIESLIESELDILVWPAHITEFKAIMQEMNFVCWRNHLISFCDSMMKFPEFINYKINEGKIKKINNKIFSWVSIKNERTINLPERLLDAFKIKINQKLLVVRGSGLALGFITIGPIYEEAKKHPEILIF